VCLLVELWKMKYDEQNKHKITESFSQPFCINWDVAKLYLATCTVWIFLYV